MDQMRTEFSQFRRRTFDLLDRRMLMMSVFGRELRDKDTGFKMLRNVVNYRLSLWSN